MGSSSSGHEVAMVRFPPGNARESVCLGFYHDVMSSDYPYHYCTYVERGEAVELPCKLCAPDRPCAVARGTFDPVPGTDATMFIQWKGTNVCLDFHCPCQPEEDTYAAHFDGYFAHYLQCGACGAIYEMGTQVKARRLADGEKPAGEPQVLRNPLAR
jgi:hypothetical protein